MKTTPLLQIILCLIIGLLASCSPKPLASTATPPPAIEIASFPSTLKIDNVIVEFSGYELDDQALKINICFAPPSEEKWYFGHIALKVKDQEFTDEAVSANSETGRADGFQCGTVIYYWNNSATPIGKAELSIGRLEVFADMDEQNCDNIQRNLDKEQTGIVITCDPDVVGRDSGFVIVKKPKSMSDDEAMLSAIDVSSYSDIVPISWRFSFLIKKP